MTADKLKILAVGDVHGDKAFIKSLADTAAKENVDLVVLAGDLTYADQSTDGIIGPFLAKGKKVLLVHGNHETPATADFLAQLYNATNLHGYGIELKGIGIFGAGGAAIGPNPTSATDIYENLKHAHDKVKHLARKLMVVHEHPSDSKMEIGGMFPGSWAVRKAAETFKPDIVVCGHIHEAGGIEEKIGKTRVINVARTPKIIEL
ncbi:metallophosphoesterase [Candidatus Woesearchaeota archaeon]|nr:metallophosphoesterase [Candidatus Woesearchaeota archaeon]